MLESIEIQDSEKYYGQDLKNITQDSDNTTANGENSEAIPGVLWKNGDVFDFLREE